MAAMDVSKRLVALVTYHPVPAGQMLSSFSSELWSNNQTFNKFTLFILQCVKSYLSFRYDGVPIDLFNQQIHCHL